MYVYLSGDDMSSLTVVWLQRSTLLKSASVVDVFASDFIFVCCLFAEADLISTFRKCSLLYRCDTKTIQIFH